jgi:hypothetical protein
MARKPKAGQRVKVGRRLLALPGVRSKTNPDPVVPAIKPGGREPEKPTEELNEELTQTRIAVSPVGRDTSANVVSASRAVYVALLGAVHALGRSALEMLHFHRPSPPVTICV